ncbi:MAG: hypothetical protein KF901_21845 [Myxococcales bacterium]|nr:hypothetical protein [Myxococcales bacterium]
MKRLLPALLTALALVTLPSAVEAKCFGFRGKNIRVCVDGNDNAARRRATSVCESVTGESCSISGDSGSSCRRSSSVRCYDGGGNEQRDITVD